MRGKDAEEASAASQELVAELANPSNLDGFRVAVVDFDGRSKVVHHLTGAVELDGQIVPLSVGRIGNGTNITAALTDALSILENAKHEDQEIEFLRPVVIAFSDGGHNRGRDPDDVATRLNEIADLVTVAFGTGAGDDLLRSLALTEQHFYRCSRGGELRAFLAAVGATMTETMAAGTNATHALTMIP